MVFLAQSLTRLPLNALTSKNDNCNASTRNRKSVLLAILRDAARRCAAPQDEVYLLKHNNLMLRSERRERREAWAANDSPISHSQYYCQQATLL